MKICMFVYNNFKNDSRVLKEAKTLVQAGHTVTVIAFLDQSTLPYEERDGVDIIRVERAPVHQSLLKRIQKIDPKEWFNAPITRVEKAPLHQPLLKRIQKIELKEWFNTLFKPIAFYGPSPANERSDIYLHNPEVDVTPKGFISEISLRIVRWGLAIVRRGLAIVRRGLAAIVRWGSAAIVRWGSAIVRWGLAIVRRGLAIVRSVALKIAVFIKKALYLAIRQIALLIHRPACMHDYYRRALQAIADKPADIYHGHDLSALPVAYWATRRHQGKFVYDSHELFIDRNTRRTLGWAEKTFLRLLEGFLIRRASATITVNESIAKALSKRYNIPTPTVIMNIPAKRTPQQSAMGKDLRHALQLSESCRLLLYSGARTFNRGLEKLIESLHYLPDSHLVLMGYGSPAYETSLHEVIEQLKLSDRVSFFGPVPSDEVILYAASADLGVAPIENACLSYYYCSPNKLFEYILAGLPIIASDFPEMSKIIRQYDIGDTFDPTDPKDIARVAQSTLERFPPSQGIAPQIRQEVAEVYNWENEARKLLDLYQTVG